MKRQGHDNAEQLNEPKAKRFKVEPDKIQWVIRNDDVVGLKYLLENGLDLENVKDELHAMHFAAQNGSVKILKYLVEVLKVDIYKPFRDGSVALHFAVGSENLDSLKYLVEVSADVEIRDQECRTPLLLASFLGWVEGIEYLVHNGACVNTQDLQGASPLNLAVMFQQLEIVKLLCDHGANINIQTQKKVTPLCQAAHMGNVPICKYLVEKGADIEIKNASSSNPLSTAAHFGRAEIVDYFIENGANCNLVVNPLWDIAIISTIKFGRFLQVLCSQDTYLDLDLALLELLEELTNQEAWQQFALTTVKSYGLKVGISNMVIEKLTASPLPSNFKEFLITELEPCIMQANCDLETFETGLLYEHGKISSPISFNAINKSFDDNSFNEIEEFYNKSPQYKVPGNYVIELAQKDAGNDFHSLTSLIVIMPFYREIAESLLEQYIPADVRKALFSALKVSRDLNLNAKDITEPVQIREINIVGDDTIQQENYESKITGDLNLDTDQA